MNIKDPLRCNPVALISQVLGGDVPESTRALHDKWSEFSDQLGSSAKAKNAIIDAIEIVRADTLQLLLSLD